MTEQLELRHLRYFIAVAEELHFGRAARKLGITQPPLSLQIQRLEAELGVQLFERTNRRVQLTPAGKTLLEEGRHVVADFNSATDAARRAARGETGSLTVAFAASVMFLSLPRIIRRFRAQFPNVRLELRELPTGPQIIALRNGELDIGFLREPSRDAELTTETVMREGLLLALSKRHELANRKRLRLADVANEDFVLFPRDLAPGLYAHVLAVCAEAGVHPRIVQTSRELYTTVSLVEAGLGVTIIPASVRQMGWRGVRYYPIGSPSASTRIDAAWRSDNKSPILPAFLDIARSEARA
jgi:LysR family transcriptional regulator, benzoate and cis,cis-muconate-responsive activator of ben and cat genes